MKRFVLLAFLCCFSITFWAQAEYQKVRDMYSVPNANIDVLVFKGHLDGVHPVEFFLGKRKQEINGYYRLVSSGETFSLTGEHDKGILILSENNMQGEQVGEMHIVNYDWNSTNPFVLQWRSLANDDLLDFTLQRSEYSDFAPLAFKSSISKYCDYSTNDCFTISIYEENKADIVFLASAKRKSIELISANPLSFELEDSRVFEYINSDKSITQNEKLRVNDHGKFTFYENENTVEIKRMYYASNNILSDVEYPIMGHDGFDNFILDLVNTQKKQTRNEIKTVQVEASAEPQSTHFQYKWNGWTEIDYLGSSIVSGRLIFNRLRKGEAERLVVPFVYDLADEKATTALEQFKGEFDIPSFIQKRVRAEIAENKTWNNLDPSSFKYYTLSDNFLLVSTDFDPTIGCSVIKIPYAELKNWVRRNSLIKKIMRA